MDGRKPGLRSSSRSPALSYGAMSGPIVQIFGTKKCQDTRKAERWWKERGVRVQLVDLWGVIPSRKLD